MPVREFVDSSGVKWRVWNTRPSRGEMLSGEFEHGWLTFQSVTSLRRCTPIPPDWETAPPTRLEQICRQAPEIRRTPSTGQRAVADDEDTSSSREDLH
jgi:hypothetical protein